MDYILRADVLDKGFVELVDVMGNDMAVVSAARVSYLSESKGEDKDRKLLNYLWDKSHSSPFEMCELKFRINMPLISYAQLVRHRTASINSQSYRYTEIDDLNFYYPTVWRSQDTKNKQGSLLENTIDQEKASELFRTSVELSIKTYHDLLDLGVAREMARMVIPQNIYTMFIWKIDLRNLLHFLDLRADSHAQWEIQQYAKAIKVMVKEKFSWTYEAWSKNETE